MKRDRQFSACSWHRLAGNSRVIAIGQVASLSRPREAWRVALLVALFAFTWQGFLAQTHQHFQSRSAQSIEAAKADNVRLQSPAKQSSSDDPVACQICRAIAHIGSYLLPAPVVFAAPLSVAVWRAVLPLSGLPVVEPSLPWHSRAPPHQLQP